MQPVLTRAQMRAIDRHTIDVVGLPALVLMETAGRAVAEATEELLDRVDSSLDDAPAVLCLAGTGNNGADAVVAARHLRERGHEVTVMVLGAEADLSPDLGTQLQIANALGLETIAAEGISAPDRVMDALRGHSVIVDGLFGTGLSRPIEGWRRRVIEVLEASPQFVVAVDIPSGVDADTGQVFGEAVTADITVSFQFAKLGQLLYPGRARCGELRITDIGIPMSQLRLVAPQTAGLIEDDTLQAAMPPRAPDSHKGSFGHLLVVAGAPDRPGAALLSARAALRAGVGLVTLGSDAETIRRLSPSLIEVMGLSLGEEQLEPERLKNALEGRSAAIIGPSLNPTLETKEMLKESLSTSLLPVVLDAGALSALGGDLGWLRGRQGATVLTPHPGEAARLLGLDTAAAVQEDRPRAALELAKRSGTYVVLKGASTLVADPQGALVLTRRGNAGLATAGTGDVLAGIIGALLAQGVEPGLAARAGVELHGLAGDRAAEAVGQRALIASDLIRYLGGRFYFDDTELSG